MPGKEALARGCRTLAWQVVHRAWRAAQQAGVITAATPAGRRFAAFGPGSIMAFPTGTLYGEAWIDVGALLIGAEVTLTAGLVPGRTSGRLPGAPGRERLRDRAGQPHHRAPLDRHR